ncbi:MAG: hypothetical protein RL179_2125 [Planctomycetota bacterium]
MRQCIPVPVMRLLGIINPLISTITKMKNHMLLKSSTFIFFIFFIIIFLPGCGNKGPEIVSVSGTVKYKEKPVADLILNFEPEDGRPSWAQSDESGRFQTKYDASQDGARVGKHKVWIIWQPKNILDQQIEQGLMKGKSSKTPEIREILKKYGDVKTTPLVIDITKAESNLEIKLD